MIGPRPLAQHPTEPQRASIALFGMCTLVLLTLMAGACGGDDSPSSGQIACTESEDCAPDQLCVNRVCVATGADDDVVEDSDDTDPNIDVETDPVDPPDDGEPATDVIDTTEDADVETIPTDADVETGTDADVEPDLPVIDARPLQVLSIAISDDAWSDGEPPLTYGGQGNNIPDAGERIQLVITVDHGLLGAISVDEAVLSTEDERVEIATSVVETSAIPSNQPTEIGPFALVLPVESADATPFSLTLTLGDHDPLDVSIYARRAAIEITDFRFSDSGGNANGIPDPGETGVLIFSLRNRAASRFPPSQISGDLNVVDLSDPSIEVRVGAFTDNAIVLANVDLELTSLAPNALLDGELTAAVRVTDDAEIGDEFCIRVTVTGSTSGELRYEFTDFYCTAITFGDVLECIDEDGDGFGFGALCDGPDCDDTDPTVYPGAPELCDGQDNNCNGIIDEGVRVTAFYDNDGDGYGDPEISEEFCIDEIPDDWVLDNTDCNDDDDTVYPGAPELCDGQDNNCNGIIDEGAQREYFFDSDGDGFGDDEITEIFCFGEQPDGWVDVGGDCNDNDDTVYPGAPELCDGQDNSCDGRIDNVEGLFFFDGDGDGWGTDTNVVDGCPPPGEPYVDRGGDCNDEDASIFPGAPELCDGQDNNCNGIIDEGFDLTRDPAHCGTCNNACVTFQECQAGTCVNICLDVDGDGFFGAGLCERAGEDCNDNDPNIYPGAPEICDNGIDENCSGYDAVCPLACTLLNQSSCRAGAKCTILALDTPQCAVNGTRTSGQTCTGFDNTDTCRSGNLCITFDVPGTPTCHEFCASDQNCSRRETICALNLVDDADGVIAQLCAENPECNPITQSCGAGERCDSYRDDRYATTTFRCFNDGVVPIGGNCTGPASACRAGGACVGGGGEFFCRSFCQTAADCLGGHFCATVTDWPTGIGVCIPS